VEALADLRGVDASASPSATLRPPWLLCQWIATGDRGIMKLGELAKPGPFTKVRWRTLVAGSYHAVGETKTSHRRENRADLISGLIGRCDQRGSQQGKTSRATRNAPIQFVLFPSRSFNQVSRISSPRKESQHCSIQFESLRNLQHRHRGAGHRRWLTNCVAILEISISRTGSQRSACWLAVVHRFFTGMKSASTWHP